jgi:hypothetical protein
MHVQKISMLIIPITLPFVITAGYLAARYRVTFNKMLLITSIGVIAACLMDPFILPSISWMSNRWVLATIIEIGEFWISWFFFKMRMEKKGDYDE